MNCGVKRLLTFKEIKKFLRQESLFCFLAHYWMNKGWHSNVPSNLCACEYAENIRQTGSMFYSVWDNRRCDLAWFAHSHISVLIYSSLVFTLALYIATSLLSIICIIANVVSNTVCMSDANQAYICIFMLAKLVRLYLKHVLWCIIAHYGHI